MPLHPTLHPTPIMIAGMHRSGTSMTARLCNLLGVDLGHGLIPAPPEENKESYWEAAEVVRLHDSIFHACDMRGDEVEPMPEGWLEMPIVAEVREGLQRWLLDQFSHGKLWGIKDPRLCRLWPVWEPVFTELHLSPRVIIPFRHPMEVAASLRRRNAGAYPAELSLAWWWLNVHEAELYTRMRKRAFIYYPDVIADWRHAMEMVARQLEITWQYDYEMVADQVAEFIEPSLRHHQAGEVPDRYDPQGRVRKLFTALMEANGSGLVNAVL